MLIASMIRLAYVDLVSYRTGPYNRADSYKRTMSTKLLSAVAMASAFFFAACSAQRPVLYPNAHLKRVGSSAAERDIEQCMQQAEDYMQPPGAAVKSRKRQLLARAQPQPSAPRRARRAERLSAARAQRPPLER